MNEKDWSTDGMILAKENINTWRKTCAMSLCPPHTLHGLAWDFFFFYI
jgi:hypothetical protein